METSRDQLEGKEEAISIRSGVPDHRTLTWTRQVTIAPPCSTALRPLSSPYNSPFRQIARNNTEPTPDHHTPAGAESTPCRFDRRRTFGEPIHYRQRNVPTLMCTGLFLVPIESFDWMPGSRRYPCTEGSRDPIGKTASLLITSASRLTFSRLRIRTGRETLESISFYRAEVHRRSHEIERLQTAGAGTGRRWKVEWDSVHPLR